MEQLPANVPAIKSKLPNAPEFICVDAWDSYVAKEEFYQKILKSKSETIVYCGQNEWDYHDAYHRFNDVLKFLESQGRTYHVITGGYPHPNEPKNTSLKVYHWIDYYMKKTFNACIHNSKSVSGSDFANFGYYKQSLERTHFNHYITSLNYRSHNHRCHLIDLMAKNNLIENNAIAWHHLNHLGGHASTYDWKYFESKQLVLSDNFNDGWMSPPKQYFDSFAQIISESTEFVTIFSEKTVMGLICHKPFLIAGPVGIHGKLKNLNFEFYDEIFDYSFDIETDREIRYQMILENFVRLQEENTLDDLVKLQKKLLPKILHNFENLKKIVFDFSTVPPLMRKMYNIHSFNGIDYNHWSNGMLESLDGVRGDFYK